jgi:hypothetical protein
MRFRFKGAQPPKSGIRKMIMKIQRVTGAGDGIRTHDPNLGKVVLNARPTASALEAKSRCGAPSIGEKLEISPSLKSKCTTNVLK